jgi:hypothetical protein
VGAPYFFSPRRVPGKRLQRGADGHERAGQHDLATFRPGDASIYGGPEKCDKARRAVAGNHMPEYLVRLLDAEGHVTHAHTIMAASRDAIVHKVASLYRSHAVVEILAGNHEVARLTTAEMSTMNSD